jgi:hypothetical protein
MAGDGFIRAIHLPFTFSVSDLNSQTEDPIFAAEKTAGFLIWCSRGLFVPPPVVVTKETVLGTVRPDHSFNLQ